jgi:hypothetical protein
LRDVDAGASDVHFSQDRHEHWHGATHDHFMTSGEALATANPPLLPALLMERG